MRFGSSVYIERSWYCYEAFCLPLQCSTSRW